MQHQLTTRVGADDGQNNKSWRVKTVHTEVIKDVVVFVHMKQEDTSCLATPLGSLQRPVSKGMRS